MSSPNQARRVTAQIFFQGADITGSMRPYFLSATYTDKEADGTDDLQLKLQDRDDIWLKKWLADAIDAAASAGSLSASSKAKTDGAAKSYKVTAKSGLNVRSGPSTSYGKYGALVCGAELQVEGIENGWAKVSYNGKTAYVSASYIKESRRRGRRCFLPPLLPLLPAPASRSAPCSFGRTGRAAAGIRCWTADSLSWTSVDASGPPNTITIKATGSSVQRADPPDGEIQGMGGLHAFRHRKRDGRCQRNDLYVPRQQRPVLWPRGAVQAERHRLSLQAVPRGGHLFESHQ